MLILHLGQHPDRKLQDSLILNAACCLATDRGSRQI